MSMQPMDDTGKSKRLALWILLGSMLVAIAILAFGMYLRIAIPRDPDHVDFWIYKLRNGDPEWRASAANILASRVGPADERPPGIEGVEDQQRIIDALMDALDDPNPRVRANAIVGLRDVESARPRIRRFMEDPDPDVRGIAQAVTTGDFSEGASTQE